MNPLNALDGSRHLRPSEREVPAILLLPADSANRPKMSPTSTVRWSREAVDTGITLLVWLVTLLVVPAGAGLAMLLS